MILILEIWLTIKAWQKGWRGWALLPLAFALTAGFAIGATAAASGESLEDMMGLMVLGELATVVTLIVPVGSTEQHGAHRPDGKKRRCDEPRLPSEDQIARQQDLHHVVRKRPHHAHADQPRFPAQHPPEKDHHRAAGH